LEPQEREQIAVQYAAAAKAVERMSVEEYSEANKIFHDAIYQGCRNPILTAEIKKLRLRLAPYLMHSFIRLGRLRSSHSEHEAITAAIRTCDERAAEVAMRQHILNGGNLYADMLAKMDP
jgi:DNA-binding GntR family transcriptional regulator